MKRAIFFLILYKSIKDFGMKMPSLCFYVFGISWVLETNNWKVERRYTDRKFNRLLSALFIYSIFILVSMLHTLRLKCLCSFYIGEPCLFIFSYFILLNVSIFTRFLFYKIIYVFMRTYFIIRIIKNKLQKS